MAGHDQDHVRFGWYESVPRIYPPDQCRVYPCFSTVYKLQLKLKFIKPDNFLQLLFPSLNNLCELHPKFQVPSWQVDNICMYCTPQIFVLENPSRKSRVCVNGWDQPLTPLTCQNLCNLAKNVLVFGRNRDRGDSWRHMWALLYKLALLSCFTPANTAL